MTLLKMIEDIVTAHSYVYCLKPSECCFSFSSQIWILHAPLDIFHAYGYKLLILPL